MSSGRSTPGRGTTAFFAICIVLLTLLIRLPSLVHPRTIDDEGVYAVVGNEIADGGRPYVDAVERKPPLLFWTYALIAKAGGQYNWPALHWIALLWVLATMGGLYVLVRRMFDPLAGVCAALLYSLYQPWGTFLNLAFNGEVMMNLPIVWAWAIAFGKGRSLVRPELLLAGALLCAGFLLKQPAAIAAVPLGIYLLLPSYARSRGMSPATAFIHAVVLTAGFFFTLAAVGFVLWREGLFRETIYWTLTNHSIPYVFWRKAVIHTVAFVGACLPMVAGAFLSSRHSRFWEGKPAERIALIGLVVASAMGTAAGARFYPHYYIQLIPPLAVLGGPLFAETFTHGNVSTRQWFLRPRFVAFAFSLTVLGFGVSHWIGEWQRRRPTEAGMYIREHTQATDRIFVWGQGAPIYLDAQRRPACRYVVTFPLTGLIFGGVNFVDTTSRIVPGAWDNLERDFERHAPEFIVDVGDSPKNTQYPIGHYPVLVRWLTGYVAVARAAEGVVYQRKRSLPGSVQK